jgi:hypothetical protein
VTSRRACRPVVERSLALYETERGRGVPYEADVVDADRQLFRERRFTFL